ncbi:hypothetical protein HRbin28_00819 [bacterium HR28]|nr:hypothetical protein HRbin28_00819 [bacterium HR28]
MHDTQQPGIHHTHYRQPGGNVPTEATGATSVHAERVEGQMVIVQQSRVEHLTGARVSLEQSTANHVEARSAQVDRSAIRYLEAERAVTLRSAIALARVRELRASRARIGLLRADHAIIEHGRIGIALVRDLSGPALVRLPLATLATFIVGLLAGALLDRSITAKRR